MTTTMFANEIQNDFYGVLSKLANGYEIRVMSDENSPIAMITPYSSQNEKQDKSDDLFGFGRILKGLDVPANKKELRKVYYERSFA